MIPTLPRPGTFGANFHLAGPATAGAAIARDPTLEAANQFLNEQLAEFNRRHSPGAERGTAFLSCRHRNLEMVSPNAMSAPLIGKHGELTTYLCSSSGRVASHPGWVKVIIHQHLDQTLTLIAGHRASQREGKLLTPLTKKQIKAWKRRARKSPKTSLTQPHTAGFALALRLLIRKEKRKIAE